MALSDDEKATLDALTKKANEPDEDDFDIEIWDETGAGAKVPYHKGKTWLQRFGIDLPIPDATGDAKPAGKKSTGAADTGDAPTGDTAVRYFGGNRARKTS
jgi:hypothetical protein